MQRIVSLIDSEGRTWELNVLDTTEPDADGIVQAVLQNDGLMAGLSFEHPVRVADIRATS